MDEDRKRRRCELIEEIESIEGLQDETALLHDSISLESGLWEALNRKGGNVKEGVRLGEKVSESVDGCVKCVGEVMQNSNTWKISFEITAIAGTKALPVSCVISSVRYRTNRELLSWVPPPADSASTGAVLQRFVPLGEDPPKYVHLYMKLNHDTPRYRFDLQDPTLGSIFYNVFGLEASAPEPWRSSSRSDIYKAVFQYLVNHELVTGGPVVQLNSVLKKEFRVSASEVPITDLIEKISERLSPPGELSLTVMIPGEVVQVLPCTFLCFGDDEKTWDDLKNIPSITAIETELSAVLDSIRDARQRLLFYRKFSHSPTAAIHSSLEGFYASSYAKRKKTPQQLPQGMQFAAFLQTTQEQLTS